MEHFFIRMNNREPGVNSEYFAIDRQGIYGPQNGRVDILGVFWPRADRRNSEKLDLCVMEMKFAMGAEIDAINEFEPLAESEQDAPTAIAYNA